MEIKRLTIESYEKMTEIVLSAYAGSFKGTPEEKERVIKFFTELCEKGDVIPLGAFEGDELLGTVLHYEFESNFHGNMIPSAGIGTLAVDLLHKKKHVAQQLIKTSFKMAKDKGINFYTLYPFDAEFYRNFGFGYGVAIDTYRVRPKDFMDKGDRSILSYAKEEDHKMIYDFYDDVALKTHGMSKKTYGDRRRLKAMKTGKVLIAKEEGLIIGYLVMQQMSLNPENNQSQKIVVNEMIYSDHRALMAFVSFFAAQKDQITYVEIATFDQYFVHILKTTHYTPKPETLNIISLKAADKAYGLMPYALEPQPLLDLLMSKTTQNIKFIIDYPNHEKKEVFLNLSNEMIEIKLSINAFSSWIYGCIGLEDLYQHQQLITDEPLILKSLDRDFYLDQPRSYTRF